MTRDHGLGMHVTWLVKDVIAFQSWPGPTSEKDCTLPFGLTYEEWFALYFDVLVVDQGEYQDWVERHPDEAQTVLPPIEFKGEISGYPLLSRICGYLCDACFELSELEQLRQECLRVQSTTSNQLALSGLEKLLQITTEAETRGLNVYLMSD